MVTRAPRSAVLAPALAVWLLLLGLAIVNGGVREALLAPAVGDDRAHQLSVGLLCAAILLATRVTVRWMRPATTREALLIGVVWVALTIAFEFGAGHYLFGASWDALWRDYHVFEGRLWILVLMSPAAG